MERQRKPFNVRRIAWLAIALFFCSAFVAVRDDLFLISKNLDIFSAVYRQVSINYVDKTNADKLIKTAVDAMLDELDPYTEYVQDADVEDYRLKYVDTRYGGIGAVIFERDSRMFIASVYAGYPAAENGIVPGDEIVAIDGRPLEGFSAAEVSHQLRGADGSAIVLQVRHTLDDRLETVPMTRVMVRQPNVSHVALLDHGVGYIKLDKFLEQSAMEMENALNGLAEQGRLNGLVIDLRDNGGGILREAVNIVNLFVPRGELVVSQKGKNSSKNRSYRTMAEPIAPDIPLAILINAHSASAAEIVAGALQDMDRAVIVGEPSFGKGLVQQTFNIPYNNLVKVTVAKYYTPAGRCIQALDFIHKDRNGRYTRVPDSVIHAFRTRAGRIVYDGSGIYPDITVVHKPYSAFTQALLSEHLVFDYATEFWATHKKIADAAEFRVDDAEYAAFVRFLEERGYHHVTDTERILQRLKIQAAVEEQPETVMQQIDVLEQAMASGRVNAPDDYRGEIKEVLGAEIVSRYHHQEGRQLFSMQHDPQLKRAMGLLGETKKEYYSILSGEGEYKVIGNPETVLAVADH